MHSITLRQTFLDFFAKKGHHIVPSSSLVPSRDPTLLFTNAGMVQFKNVFLGEPYPHTRAASVQRCVRAGGKHNDLENVGYTARHHTFFEMLGNFSFGDYFKREAIQYAWEFLTKVLGLPEEKLWVTVYEEDAEAEAIWRQEMKINPQRFSRCGKQDNFWAMGDTGPCGPCTEIFYDHGAEIAGGPPGTPEADGDRYVEIWNLVFMQYERDAAGNLHPLPKPSVDTGMGLERIAAVMQGVHNNFDTDLFRNLILATAELAKTEDLQATSLRVIADHIRSSAFLITDGVIPSNEGRGYVLRRIIRRAIRHGFQLGLQEPFLHQLVAPLVIQLEAAYPELKQAQVQIERALQQEEEQFARTLAQGLQILERDLANLSQKTIPGSTLFKLYDTYGFPLDLTADYARERGYQMDYAGFEQEMEQQRQLSQAASTFQANYPNDLSIGGAATGFVGYEALQSNAQIIALYKEGKPVTQLCAGEAGSILLNQTPFYAEAGGQVGDQGWIAAENKLFEVQNTRKVQAQYSLHEGVVKTGDLTVNMPVQAQVDTDKRKATAVNHSATHLLHAALRHVLGAHVQQKGSLVEPSRLRFDFTHSSALTVPELQTIEDLVNQQIRANHCVNTQLMALAEAKAQGVMALFDEKYGDEVRVLRMGDFSQELCGGTHVTRTGDIGVFKIIAESGIASGIRRIEALTGEAALAWLNQEAAQVKALADLLKVPPHDLLDRLQQLLEKQRQLEKTLATLQATLLYQQSDELLQQVQTIDDVKVLAVRIDNADIKALRETVDRLKDKLGKSVVLLAKVQGDKVDLIAGVNASGDTRLHAGNVIQHVAVMVGGKGGGRADLAQAGGNKPDALPQALQAVYTYISHLLQTKA